MHKDITNTDILVAMNKALSACNIPHGVDISVAHGNATTIGSLALDSLDLLQFAMEVEEILDIEIDVVEFPPEATLQEVADHILALIANQETSGRGVV